MTKTEMEALRQNLLAMRDRHNGDVSHLTDEALHRTGGGATSNLSNMPIHMADLGTDNFEQEFTLSLLQTEEQLLEEIAAALERMKQGAFGKCEECQGETSARSVAAHGQFRIRQTVPAMAAAGVSRGRLDFPNASETIQWSHPKRRTSAGNRTGSAPRGSSSVGRALESHSRGREFKSPLLH